MESNDASLPDSKQTLVSDVEAHVLNVRSQLNPGMEEQKRRAQALVDEVPKVEMPSPGKGLAHSGLKRQHAKDVENPILIQDDNRQRAPSRAETKIEQLETKLDVPADKDADFGRSRSSRLFRPYQMKGFTDVKIEFVEPPRALPLPPPEKETQFVSRDWHGSSGLLPKARVRMTEHAVKLMEYNT